VDSPDHATSVPAFNLDFLPKLILGLRDVEGGENSCDKEPELWIKQGMKT
jgi:hypothetical protein